MRFKMTIPYDIWLHRHHGEVFHPLEIVAVLGRFFDYPLQKYFHLEMRGHLRPLNYKNGEVSAVEIFAPDVPRTRDIERESSLQRGSVAELLRDLTLEEHISISDAGIPPEAITQLANKRYIHVDNGSVSLDKNGFRLLERGRRWQK